MFQAPTVSAARALVLRHAARAGMAPARSSDLALAVSEVATNSVLHAGGWGTLTVWHEPAALVCEVADTGGADGRDLAPRTGVPGSEGGYGLKLADRLCERVEVRAWAGGTVVRLEMAL